MHVLLSLSGGWLYSSLGNWDGWLRGVSVTSASDSWRLNDEVRGIE